MRRCAVVVALLAVSSGCSVETLHNVHSRAATQRVEVTMDDMAFQPAAVSVETGTRVTFVFRNLDDVTHEATLGVAAEHAGRGRDHRHGAATKRVAVPPGQTAEIEHLVDGDYVFGCHEPGHWEAGMMLIVHAE